MREESATNGVKIIHQQHHKLYRSSVYYIRKDTILSVLNSHQVCHYFTGQLDINYNYIKQYSVLLSIPEQSTRKTKTLFLIMYFYTNTQYGFNENINLYTEATNITTLTSNFVNKSVLDTTIQSIFGLSKQHSEKIWKNWKNMQNLTNDMRNWLI